MAHAYPRRVVDGTTVFSTFSILFSNRRARSHHTPRRLFFHSFSCVAFFCRRCCCAFCYILPGDEVKNETSAVTITRPSVSFVWGQVKQVSKGWLGKFDDRGKMADDRSSGFFFCFLFGAGERLFFEYKVRACAV